MPDLSNNFINEISNNSLNAKEKEDFPTVDLEISFEEDDDDFEEFKFLKRKNQEDVIQKIESLPENIINEVVIENEL